MDYGVSDTRTNKEYWINFYLIGVSIATSISGVIIFLSSWVYCTASYGYLLGFGLGWIPSFITAYLGSRLVGYIWPLVFIILISFFWPLIMDITTHK